MRQKEAKVIYKEEKNMMQWGEQGGVGRGEDRREIIRSMDDREMTVLVACCSCKSGIFSYKL